MGCTSRIELRDLKLELDLGTYKTGDVIPDGHFLDLDLSIDPALVLIDADEMTRVFDYDPLIAEIDRLCRIGHYETQERLMTCIVEACANHSEIQDVTVVLRKSPVQRNTGSLGVRLFADADYLNSLRK